ncbi:unnamed protein product [Leptosia nina]|uniref:Tyr recombinase domain-containing protein n=1 Tax=Leptosia nina TaxID=320188 RepID=A0AAV1JTL2_9NEOP
MPHRCGNRISLTPGDMTMTMETSWRDSTSKTYECAWNNWNKPRGLNPLHPTGEVLARFLADPHVVEDEANVFQSCRHTALLLILYSGRRIHDLTLLAADSKRMHQDPVFWVGHCTTLLRKKREERNLINLFLNIRRKPKAASRTFIAGWIKTLLVDAGIKASPGSLRSAVASKSSSKNCPLDEILSKENWRSLNTFARFYCKEVVPLDKNLTIFKVCLLRLDK